MEILCRLCGRDASKTKEYWKLQFFEGLEEHELADSFCWDKGLYWNDSLECFCIHHAWCSRLGRHGRFSEYYAEEASLVYEGPLDKDENRFTWYVPTDEGISMYLCDYLQKLAVRETRGLPLVECQALWYQGNNYEDVESRDAGYLRLGKCPSFAREKVNGRWVCGRHNKPHHEYEDSKLKGRERTDRPYIVAKSILSKWKKEVGEIYV